MALLTSLGYKHLSRTAGKWAISRVDGLRLKKESEIVVGKDSTMLLREIVSWVIWIWRGTLMSPLVLLQHCNTAVLFYILVQELFNYCLSLWRTASFSDSFKKLEFCGLYTNLIVNYVYFRRAVIFLFIVLSIFLMVFVVIKILNLWHFEKVVPGWFQGVCSTYSL